MDENTREKMVSAIEKAMRTAGAESYEQGLKDVNEIFQFVNDGLRSLKSVDDLRKTLDSMPDLQKHEEAIMLLLMKQLPQVIRIGLKMASNKAKSTLPSPSGGRPTVFSAEETLKVVNCVAELHRRGSSLEVAKSRTAQKFGCGLRTIERLWANRGAIPDDEPTIDDAFKFIAQNQKH